MDTSQTSKRNFVNSLITIEISAFKSFLITYFVLFFIENVRSETS